MANKVEIVFNADGSRAIRAMQEIGATARATGEANSQAARAMATAAKLAGDTVSAQSIRIIQAREREKLAAAEYAKLQTAVRKGTLDESVGVTALAAAYQRLTAAKLATAVADKAASGGGASHTYASLRETIGGLRIGEILPETLGAAAGIAAMALAASKLKEAVGDTLEFAEAIQRASEKTGLQAETLSTLHYAAAVTGGDFDGMTNAVAKMDRTIAQATEGNKTAAAFLRSLGLNAKELAASPDGAERAFRKFAITLAATENPIRRVELATGLLGRAGAEQIPTIIQLGENWQKYADGAERTGTMLNGTTLKGLIATKEQIEQMHQTVLGVEVGLTEGLTPALDQMLSVIAGGKTPMDSLNEIGKDLGKTFAFVASVLTEMASAGFRAAAASSALSGVGLIAGQSQKMWAQANTLEGKAAQLTDVWMGRTPQTGGGDQALSMLGVIRDRNARGGASGDGFGGIGDITGNPDEKKFHAMRAALEQQKLLHKLSLADEQDYWERMLATTSKKKDPGLFALITPEVVKAQSALAEELFRGWTQAAATAKREGEEIHAELLKTWEDMNKQDDAMAKARYATETAGILGAGDKRLSDLMASDQVREFQLRMAPVGDAYRAIAADHGAEYDARRGNLNEALTRASGAPGDTPEEIAARAREIEAIQKEIDALDKQRALQQAEDDARVRSTTLLGGASDALAEFARDATDAGAVMKNWLGGAINSTNDAIVKALTTHGPHQDLFKQAGHEIFTSATSSLLKYGEGKLLGALGIGGKADGSSEAQALWVRMGGGHGGGKTGDALASWLGGGSGAGDDTSDAGAGLLGGKGGGGVVGLLGGLLGGKSGGAGGLLGGLLGKIFHHGGGDSSMEASDIAEAMGGGIGSDPGMGGKSSISVIGGGLLSGAGKALGFLADLMSHIPGFAEGVNDFGGGLAVVGEAGPELVNLPRGASVIPNRTAFGDGAGGGGHTFHNTISVDARGATDPAQVEAAGYRGAMRAAPQIHAAVLTSIRDANTRFPPSRKPY